MPHLRIHLILVRGVPLGADLGNVVELLVHRFLLLPLASFLAPVLGSEMLEELEPVGILILNRELEQFFRIVNI